MVWTAHLLAICSLLVPCLAGAVYEARRVLVVAGNFTLDGERLNIAQFDLKTEQWSNKFQAQVYLFGEDNGAIFDIAVNYSSRYDNVVTVGLFDTVTKTSQIQLCSVANFDGLTFEKVGEGLCYRGMDSASILIHTVVLGRGGDIFVGGNFATRVWDGHHFVYVYHVARYDARTSSWLPLSGGGGGGGGELRSSSIDATHVNALAWDDKDSILFIGGSFRAVDNHPISAGIAIWSEDGGLASFPGGGLSNDGGAAGEVQALAFESRSKSLFVTGAFDFVGALACRQVAVWNALMKSWRCLSDSAVSFSAITAMMLDRNSLYLAGAVRSTSTWSNTAVDHAIARLSIVGYVDETIELSDNASAANQTAVGVRGVEQAAPRLSPRRDRRLRAARRALASGRRLQDNSSASDGIDIRDWILPFGGSRHHHASTDSNSSKMPPDPPAAVQPWEQRWHWLPGFPGTNGPVLKLDRGRRELDGAVLISGHFDNLPPLLVWLEVAVPASPQAPAHLSGNTTMLGGRHEIRGSISSIAEVLLPYELPSVDPTQPPDAFSRDYTFVVLLACVGVGVLIGLGFTASCFSRWSFPQGDSMAIYEAATDPQGSLGQLSLKTLCDGQGGSVAMDFKVCFERAMKTRHLPTYEALVVINPKEILLSRIIGEGSFGRVWSGQWRNNAVAVKEFVFAQAAIAGGSLQRNNIIEEIVGEAGVMSCLRHPKILQLYGCSLTMQAIWIVSELCIRGSLKMVLSDHTLELPLIKRLSICMDVADGMQYLHNRSHPIIHRDLKSHNIFITEPFPGHFVAKIGDWGSARAVALTGAKNMTHGVGTACWLAPEVINNAHFSKFSDVYAFGIILWEVFTRQEVYEGLSAPQIIAKVGNDGLRPSVPRDCPWAMIMTDCWKQEPVGRPNFQTILVALSKIYLRYNQARDAAAASEDTASNEDSEQQPLLTASTDGMSVMYGALSQRMLNVTHPRPDSPSTAAARKRIREYQRDSFHPSLENIEVHRKSVGGVEDADAEAQAQLTLVPHTFLVTDEFGNLTAPSPMAAADDCARSQYSPEEADPLDFLFGQSVRSRYQPSPLRDENEC